MKIKICGITRTEEAQYLNEQQTDFAGFVLFFPKSRRNITIGQAAEIMGLLDDSIKKIAVVVSPDTEQIRQIEDAGFDFIQIHGALTEDVLSAVSLPVLKAFNVSDMEQYPVWRQCEKIAGYVFDAAEPGSGKTFDWDLVQTVPRDEKLLILAGGLNPDNVAQAVRAIRPDGVDVSSGVEFDDKPGKDPAKIRKFIQNARNAVKQ